MKHKDIRMKLINEILAGIKVDHANHVFSFNVWKFNLIGLNTVVTL